ncbi:hypothetical protein QJS10_CPA05g00660 [Acorus calamus]|uniref:Uncharacterized protein n=1 Tax=Acorus calamus TaxID=4465 RepID=A0AAV9ES83_ACOCL|nr:hypothetical protein QJS10_CPA05g00660 [Acorus calamus]
MPEVGLLGNYIYRNSSYEADLNRMMYSLDSKVTNDMVIESCVKPCYIITPDTGFHGEEKPQTSTVQFFLRALVVLMSALQNEDNLY